MLCYHDSSFALQRPEIRSVYDVCVYGGTAGGVMAAVEAARRGLTVLVLEPAARIGGLTASGLGFTVLSSTLAQDATASSGNPSTGASVRSCP